VQQASLHSDTSKQPSDLQGDNGTTSAELSPPRDNNSGEDNSSSSDNEESLFSSSVIDLISVQQEEIEDVAMEVECESVQQNQVHTKHHPVCAWGMDARTASYFENRYGEYCCLGIRMGQTPCNHNGCNAIVHPICHINWLSCMDLNIHNNNPVTCPRHSIQYQDYVRMQECRNNGAARGDDGSSVERAKSVNWISVQQAEGPDSMLENILAALLDNYEVFRGMAATDDELDRLQRRTVSEEDISRLGQGCIICISGFVMGEIITTLPFFYVFHANCLATWLMINGVCPICN
jgi:hypothetical protein